MCDGFVLDMMGGGLCVYVILVEIVGFHISFQRFEWDYASYVEESSGSNDRRMIESDWCCVRSGMQQCICVKNSVVGMREHKRMCSDVLTYLNKHTQIARFQLFGEIPWCIAILLRGRIVLRL